MFVKPVGKPATRLPAEDHVREAAVGGQRAERDRERRQVRGRRRAARSRARARLRRRARRAPRARCSRRRSRSRAKQTAETAIVDATEMSISPAMTTNVRPNASSPMKTYGVTRSSRFAALEEEARERPAPDPGRRGSARRAAPPSARARAERCRSTRAHGSASCSCERATRPVGAGAGVLEALRDERVDRDRDDDRRALEEDLPELRDPQQREAVVDRRDEQGAEHAPRIVPEPPKTLTPPITTAVMTSSSKPRAPRSRRRSRSATANMKPPSPASAPLMRERRDHAPRRPGCRRAGRRRGSSRSRRSRAPREPSAGPPRRRARRRARSRRAPGGRAASRAARSRKRFGSCVRRDVLAVVSSKTRPR